MTPRVCRSKFTVFHAVNSSGIVHGYVVNGSKQSRMSVAVLLVAAYLMVHNFHTTICTKYWQQKREPSAIAATAVAVHLMHI